MLTTQQQEHFTQLWTQAQSTVACFVHSLGRVNLTGAVFLFGSLILRSGISFHIASDATLLGSSDPAHYRSGCWPALLLADSATDLHLSGKGTINGQATSPDAR